MKELREIFKSKFDVLLEKSKLPSYALGKLRYNFAQADKENLNHRTYSEDLLIREIEKKKLELEDSKTIGQLDHPFDGHTKLQDSMHLLGDISYDKNLKVGVAESYILDTRSGRDFLVLLKTGISLGPSMRGFGNVNSQGKVENDWKLETIDFVLKPSFGDDVAIDQTNLIESANQFLPAEKKEYKMKKINKEDLLRVAYSKNINENKFSGSFEDYKKANEKYITIALLQSEGNYTFSEAVKKVMGEEGQKDLNRKKQIQQKVEIKDIFMEAQVAGISPKIYAEKINAEVDRQNEAITNSYSENVQLILQEARMAGADTDNPKIRKKILENLQQQSKAPVKIQLSEEEIKKQKAEDESLDYSYLAGEKIAAGFKGNK